MNKDISVIVFKYNEEKHKNGKIITISKDCKDLKSFLEICSAKLNIKAIKVYNLDNKEILSLSNIKDE